MIPFNDKFNDTYWNKKDPLAQSFEVFASAASNRASRLRDSGGLGFSCFVVAELGFGAGLNFITTACEFMRLDMPLCYVGIEGGFLGAQNIAKIYDDFKLPPPLDEMAKTLISRLKSADIKPGFNRIKINHLISLDLLIGEANKMLKMSEFNAHVWYLDGFAPSKNPAMWSDEAISEVARLSQAGTTLSTYSAASAVKRALESAGFSVTKLSGVGKRERLSAVLNQDIEQKPSDDVYFLRVKSELKTAPKVLVIGAGIAGIATAYELKALGCEVIVAEKCGAVASNGSSNEIGELMPLITRHGVLLGEFHELCARIARAFYAEHLPPSLCLFHAAYAYAFSDELCARYETRDDYDSALNAVKVPNAACLKPKKSCEFLAASLDIRLNHELISLDELEHGWLAKFKLDNTQVALNADIVVLCMGSDSERVFGRTGRYDRALMQLDGAVAISSVRGQTTLIADSSAMLKPGIDPLATHSAKGYITAAFDGARVIGSSFARGDYDALPRASDDMQNIDDVSEFLRDEVQILGSNVGFRSYSGDRFAIVGAVHDQQAYASQYAKIFWGKKSDKSPKYKNGLFINSAHGARGLGSAIIGASLIADLIANRPLCLPREMFRAVHPARFMIRKLKKGIK